MQHRRGLLRKNKSAVLSSLGTALLALAFLSWASATEAPNLTNGWRLVRSADPSGGPDAISVDHTADVSRSDLDFAGLMLRCGAQAPEVAIIALTPFTPRAKPNVTISANGKDWRFVAQVVPPGAELLLPQEATTLAYGPWQHAHELSITVTSPEQSFAGLVPIDGLPEALTALTANCAPH
jgi:hypothetical protein